jgi:2-methylisocitrate lyase-like PEP mutase family enzyme
MSQITQQAKGTHFRQLHQGPQVLMLPNAWDVGSALMLQHEGFPALATTSAGIAYAQGVPDHECLSRAQMLDAVARIAARVTVPVTADLETGYGQRPEDVADTIRQAIAAGVVGGNLEDRHPHEAGALLDLHLACERIHAARQAADASGIPFVVNARTDPFLCRLPSMPHTPLDEAIRRGNAYRAAGADCIFVPGVADAATIGRLTEAIAAPLNVLGGFAGTAALPVSDLCRLGVRRVTLGGSLALAVFALIRRVAQEIHHEGTFSYATQALSNREMNHLLV